MINWINKYLFWKFPTSEDNLISRIKLQRAIIDKQNNYISELEAEVNSLRDKLCILRRIRQKRGK
jgi:hypothetical protein